MSPAPVPIIEEYLDIPLLVQREDIPINRHNRREMNRELAKIYPMLSAIEDSFLKAVHDESPEVCPYYSVLYTQHLDWFTATVQYLNLCTKPVFFVINETYFAKLYSPLEKWKNQ